MERPASRPRPTREPERGRVPAGAAVPVLTLAPGPNAIPLSLKQLVRSRMLIQANSGGGKSHAVRYLMELTHGHIQQFILDPEGEYSTLREHFPFIVAGRDGDVPADPTSAGLLCRRLMRLNVSAVLDLYDLVPEQRRQFVRRFLEELMNLPRADWHPVLVALDEAHVFAPESGKGQAESTEAVITLCTQGRKRGATAILATQRLAKLRNDAAAELHTKLIGLTSLPSDIQSAGNELGFDKQQRLTLPRLEPGTFYAFGPAIAREVVLLRTGAVRTTHPEPGQLTPPTPPPPEQIRAVIAQLQDLPQAAAAEARDLAAAQAENAELRRQVQTLKAAQAKAAPDPTAVDRRIAAAVTHARAPLEARLQAQDELLAQVRHRTAQLAALLDVPATTGNSAGPAPQPAPETAERPAPPAPPAPTTAPRQRAAQPRPAAPARPAVTDNPELNHLLTVPPIVAKLAQAGAPLEPAARAHLPRILAACWTTALRPEDLAEARGTLSPDTRRRIRAASQALLAIHFLVDDGGGRLRVNHAELERLRGLHQAISS